MAFGFVCVRALLFEEVGRFRDGWLTPARGDSERRGSLMMWMLGVLRYPKDDGVYIEKGWGSWTS